MNRHSYVCKCNNLQRCHCYITSVNNNGVESTAATVCSESTVQSTDNSSTVVTENASATANSNANSIKQFHELLTDMEIREIRTVWSILLEDLLSNTVTKSVLDVGCKDYCKYLLYNWIDKLVNNDKSGLDTLQVNTVSYVFMSIGQYLLNNK